MKTAQKIKYLLNYFTGTQITLESLLSGGAEMKPTGTPHLTGNTDSTPLASAAGIPIKHQCRLNGLAVFQLKEELPGLSSVETFSSSGFNASRLADSAIFCLKAGDSSAISSKPAAYSR
jgi:hypothetical protein